MEGRDTYYEEIIELVEKLSNSSTNASELRRTVLKCWTFCDNPAARYFLTHELCIYVQLSSLILRNAIEQDFECLKLLDTVTHGVKIDHVPSSLFRLFQCLTNLRRKTEDIEMLCLVVSIQLNLTLANKKFLQLLDSSIDLKAEFKGKYNDRGMSLQILLLTGLVSVSVFEKEGVVDAAAVDFLLAYINSAILSKDVRMTEAAADLFGRLNDSPIIQLLVTTHRYDLERTTLKLISQIDDLETNPSAVCQYILKVCSMAPVGKDILNLTENQKFVETLCLWMKQPIAKDFSIPIAAINLIEKIVQNVIENELNVEVGSGEQRLISALGDVVAEDINVESHGAKFVFQQQLIVLECLTKLVNWNKTLVSNHTALIENLIGSLMKKSDTVMEQHMDLFIEVLLSTMYFLYIIEDEETGSLGEATQHQNFVSILVHALSSSSNSLVAKATLVMLSLPFHNEFYSSLSKNLVSANKKKALENCQKCSAEQNVEHFPEECANSMRFADMKRESTINSVNDTEDLVKYLQGYQKMYEVQRHHLNELEEHSKSFRLRDQKLTNANLYLKKEVCHWQNQFEKGKEAAQKIELEKSHLELDLNGLKKALKDLREEKTSAENNACKLEKQVQSLEKTICSHEAELKCQREMRKLQEEQIANFNQRELELQEETQKFQEENQRLTSCLAQSQKSLQELKEENDCLKKSLDKTKKTTDKEMKQLRVELAERNKKSDNDDATIEHLRSELQKNELLVEAIRGLTTGKRDFSDISGKQ